jgi:tight adherence protein C
VLVRVALTVAALAGCVLLAPRAARARAARLRREAIGEDLSDVVDLLALAVGAGLTINRAVEAVGRWGSGPLAAELARISAEVAAGRRLADCLDELPVLVGDDVRPLTAGLVACERYGAPIADTLSRLAVEARAASRRRSEEAIRRLPVKLVFPLVLCILPAFALLTVAPLVAGALGALRQ